MTPEEIAALKAKLEAERRKRLELEITNLATEGRFNLNEVASWLELALKDEATEAQIMARLRAMPVQTPGNDPVGPMRDDLHQSDVRIIAAAGNDVSKWIMTQGTPALSKRLLKGESVTPQALAQAAIQNALIIRKNLPQLLPIVNTNTVATELKRNVIMSQSVRAFKRNVLPISAFCTVFHNVPLQGTAKVEVPYYALDTQASKDWVANDGYVFDKNTDTGVREITINKRKYQPFDYSSEDFRRQPYFNTLQLAMLKAEQLGVDVSADVFSVISVANYGASIYAQPAATFDYADTVDLRIAANKIPWPKSGRSLVVNSDADGSLLKDPSVAEALNFGGSQPKQEGAIPVIAGFRYFDSDAVPTAENLIGFIAFMSAILVATSPIEPAPGVRRNLVSYDIAIDPDTGIGFEYRHWGEPQKDGDREVIEANYGFAKGEATALKRLTSQ